MPGFPVPRADMELTAAGNTPLALVAAGPVSGEPEDVPEEVFAARLAMGMAEIGLLTEPWDQRGSTRSP